MRLTRFILVMAFLAVAAVSAVQSAGGPRRDTEVGPVLQCASETLDVSVKDGDSALLAGITAEDEQDGNLTDQVLITGISRLTGDNTARVSYVVFDSDNNMASLSRSIRYTDYRLPRFSLNAPLIYRENDSVQLLDRLHAEDVIDGDITNAIRVTDNTGSSEFQSIKVQVTNSMGDTAWLELPVVLLESDAAVVDVTLHTYLVYLEQGSRFYAENYFQGASLNGAPIGQDNVTISGEVDTETPGTYHVEYTCVYGSLSGTSFLTVVVE